jgi:hypothetical protein
LVVELGPRRCAVDHLLFSVVSSVPLRASVVNGPQTWGLADVLLTKGFFPLTKGFFPWPLSVFSVVPW